MTSAAGGAHPLLQRPLVGPLLQAIREEARPRDGRVGSEGVVEGATMAAASVSLPRLSKRLGVGASVVLRELTLLGDAALGGIPGPDWVRVEQDDGRWLVALTLAGQAQAAQWAADTDK